MFLFLRNPVTRFVSGFFSRQRQGAPRYRIPWSLNEAIAFSRFPCPNQLALALCSSNESERDNAVHAMRSIQHVRDSYWKWLNSKDYWELRAEDILFIGLQQNLVGEFELLKTKLRLPASLLLPSDDMIVHRTPADRRSDADSNKPTGDCCSDCTRPDPNIADRAHPMAFKLVEQYDAFQDNPWPMLYRELDRTFAGSKFILTVRPVDKRIKSVVSAFNYHRSFHREPSLST